MKKSIATIALAILGTTATAWAQNAQTNPDAATQATQTTAQAAAPKSSDIADADVKNFAKAQGEVQKIQDKYTKKLQNATQDPEKSAQLQGEAQEKMLKAVESSGLDAEKYNQILLAAQSDPEMRKRIEANM